MYVRGPYGDIPQGVQFCNLRFQMTWFKTTFARIWIGHLRPLVGRPRATSVLQRNNLAALVLDHALHTKENPVPWILAVNRAFPAVPARYDHAAVAKTKALHAAVVRLFRQHCPQVIVQSVCICRVTVSRSGNEDLDIAAVGAQVHH